MNVENIKRVRDAIAATDPRKFDMSTWATSFDRNAILHDCNTAACIGGWTEAVCGASESICGESAGELLGLADGQYGELFCPPGFVSRAEEYTPARAVAVLDHLMATGCVDWSVTPAEAA